MTREQIAAAGEGRRGGHVHLAGGRDRRGGLRRPPRSRRRRGAPGSTDWNALFERRAGRPGRPQPGAGGLPRGGPVRAGRPGPRHRLDGGACRQPPGRRRGGGRARPLGPDLGPAEEGHRGPGPGRAPLRHQGRGRGLQGGAQRGPWPGGQEERLGVRRQERALPVALDPVRGAVRQAVGRQPGRGLLGAVLPGGGDGDHRPPRRGRPRCSPRTSSSWARTAASRSWRSRTSAPTSRPPGGCRRSCARPRSSSTPRAWASRSSWRTSWAGAPRRSATPEDFLPDANGRSGVVNGFFVENEGGTKRGRFDPEARPGELARRLREAGGAWDTNELGCLSGRHPATQEQYDDWSSPPRTGRRGRAAGRGGDQPGVGADHPRPARQDHQGRRGRGRPRRGRVRDGVRPGVPRAPRAGGLRPPLDAPPGVRGVQREAAPQGRPRDRRRRRRGVPPDAPAGRADPGALGQAGGGRPARADRRPPHRAGGHAGALHGLRHRHRVGPGTQGQARGHPPRPPRHVDGRDGADPALDPQRAGRFLV